MLRRRPVTLDRPRGRYPSLAALGGQPALAQSSLHLALTPSQKPTDLMVAGEAFGAALGKLVGVPIRVTVASDYAAVVEALRNRTADLAFVHPAGYVLANREAKAMIVAKDQWHGNTSYTSRIYVRKESGLKTLEDLRGKTIAFVDPSSTSGYVYPMVMLIEKGLVQNKDPKTFFKEFVFSGSHDAGLQALLHGHVDAFASFDQAREQYLKDPAEREKVIYDRRERADSGGRDLRARRARPGAGREGARGAPVDEGSDLRAGPQGALRHRRVRAGGGPGVPAGPRGDGPARLASEALIPARPGPAPPAPAGPMIEMRGLRVVLPPDTVALYGVDLVVEPGEFVVIIGRSGAGKTTFLRAINRLVEPTSGTVRVAGQPVTGTDPGALRRCAGRSA